MTLPKAMFYFLMLLTACHNPAESLANPSNVEFKVERLFTVDEITVYRFTDGARSHYFASKGSTFSNYGKQMGKCRNYFPEEIPTCD